MGNSLAAAILAPCMAENLDRLPVPRSQALRPIRDFEGTKP
jgi:hypothetical protein